MNQESFIPGKDASLEASISTLRGVLAARGFDVEEASWLNPVDGVWSVHLRDTACPIMFSNGKGASQLAARASALGEFVERVEQPAFLDALLPGCGTRRIGGRARRTRALVCRAGRR
ncbi:MAG: hypothetical protein QM803_19155 [Rhodocyclaceae bacterium]